jgi:hypothetical protein
MTPIDTTTEPERTVTQRWKSAFHGRMTRADERLTTLFAQLDRLTAPPWATWAFCFLVVGIHLLPRAVLGTSSIVTIHDCLDSDFLYRVLIGKPGRLLDYGVEIPELLNGVPRVGYPTGLSISAWLFALLPPFSAYVVLEQVVHVIGFWGMYWLLTDHLPGQIPRWLRLVLAFTFACLPFYIIHEASISGQAGVGWAILHLYRGTRDHRRKLAWAVLAVFPFVSVLPTAGAFVVLVVGSAATVTCIVQRRLHRDVWLGIALLVSVYCIVNLSFVHTMLTHSYPTHREEWKRGMTWSRYFNASNRIFLLGQYHAVSVPSVCLAAMTVTAIAAVIRREHALLRSMIGFLAVCAVLSYLPRLSLSPWAEGLREKSHLVNTVNFRTFWCVAPICFFGFAYALQIWWVKWRRRVLVVLVAGFEVYWVLSAPPETAPELHKNFTELVRTLRGLRLRQVTYADFVAAPVYDEVNRYIARPQDSYHVLSVGIDPARAAYNGFLCADGYHNNYPLEYKHRFRRAIATNIEDDEWMQVTFDNWGSRAFAFIPGAGSAAYKPTKFPSDKPIADFTLSHRALYDLNVEYVFASAKLEDPRLERSLSYERSFEVSGVPLVIHLYKVRKLSSASRFLEEKLRSARERAKQSED